MKTANNESPDRKKWQTIKVRTHYLLKEISIKEGRVLSFKTGDLIQQNPQVKTYSQSIAEKMTGTTNSVPIPQYYAKVNTPPSVAEKKVSKKAPFWLEHQDVLKIIGQWIMLLFSFFAISWFGNSYAMESRKPMGEFSALVENNKTRGDFKTEKSLKQFIKKEEKKYLKK